MSKNKNLLEKVDSIYGRIEAYKKEYINKMSAIAIDVDDLKKEIKEGTQEKASFAKMGTAVLKAAKEFKYR